MIPPACADSLYQALVPYSASPDDLLAVKSMSRRQYHTCQPAALFTQEDAGRIATIAEHAVSDVSREHSKLDWKIVLAANSIFLVPKKGLLHDITGFAKRGRVALHCSHNGVHWKATIVFALSAHKGKTERFIDATKYEEHLRQLVGPDCIQKPIFVTNKSFCFYERLECLYFWRHNRSIQELKKVALSAATKVLLLHKKDVTVIDLKNENFLVTKAGEVLLCDVDQMRINQYDRTREDGGTEELYSPELLTHNITEGKASDVFAFGCCLLELISGYSGPWLITSGQQRKLDADTMQKYRYHANTARNSLEGELVGSTKRALFMLAKWAQHPSRDKRPTMEQVCRYLQKEYPLDDDLAPGELETYLSLETG